MWIEREEEELESTLVLLVLTSISIRSDECRIIILYAVVYLNRKESNLLKRGRDSLLIRRKNYDDFSFPRWWIIIEKANAQRNLL